MTVSHGLRSSYQREQARYELVERAVATTDGAEYRTILASVAPEDWYGFWRDLVFRVGVPIVPEYVAHRQAKARALAEENARRSTRAVPPEG